MKTKALFSASDVSGFPATYAAPSDVSSVLFTSSIYTILSTGLTQQVFDRLSTAMKCIHFMETNRLYHISPNEYITVINLRSKLLVLEHTYINQKMMDSYVLTDHGSEVRAIHRSMADMVSLSEALASVGFRCIGLPWNLDANPKMETDRADKDRPRIQVVDYVYKSPTLPHSNLQDASPIVMPGV